MTPPPQRLYGPKQIALIAGSMFAGICLFLFRYYHANGRFGPVVWISTGITIAIVTTIAVVMVRRGNKTE